MNLDIIDRKMRSSLSTDIIVEFKEVLLNKEEDPLGGVDRFEEQEKLHGAF